MLNMVRVQLEAYDACRKEGEEHAKVKIAQAMLKEKIKLEIIAKTTGLTIEKIKDLQIQQ